MTKKELRKMIIPLLVLLLCGVAVFMERRGVLHPGQDTQEDVLVFSDELVSVPECLVICDVTNEVYAENLDMLDIVFDGMEIGYDVCTPADFEKELLDSYRTVVLAISDWSMMGEKMFDLADWVKNGGHMMNTMTPEINGTFQAMSGLLGIVNGEASYTTIFGITIKEDAMVGIEEDTSFVLSEEGMDVSLGVRLAEDCQVYITSEDGSVPLLWKKQYGDGTFVVLNEVFVDIYQRGILSTAYTLMEEVCIYPVINGSAYYLDDFPSPVPEGDGTYIERDYGVNIATFYSVIWWPEVLKWQETYGIKYTGVVIENYSDDIEAPFERNELSGQFETYGNMLLNIGGEIGFHGYNHMPLCISGIDDDRQFADYVLWPSDDDIVAAMTELKGFCTELYPGTKFQVYVPPSNIISDAGINALKEACPDIKVIAGTYLEDGNSNVYRQEFRVDERGIIHTPRVISGCVFDDYSILTAVTELNFHFVQNHFTHPDDVLDEDRGAALGWEKLSDNWEAYIQWICESVPMMRDMTGSELGTAVLQYDHLSMQRHWEEGILTVNLGGFSGEAYFMLRINEGTIEDTIHCEIEHIVGDLYLVHATDDEIQIITK